jgi:hypothetical protein
VLASSHAAAAAAKYSAPKLTLAQHIFISTLCNQGAAALNSNAARRASGYESGFGCNR